MIFLHNLITIGKLFVLNWFCTSASYKLAHTFPDIEEPALDDPLCYCGFCEFTRNYCSWFVYPLILFCVPLKVSKVAD